MYEGWKTACQRELGKPPLKAFKKIAGFFHGLRKTAVCNLLEVGCTTQMVSAIVGMSEQMVNHYAKDVNKFHLARSAIKLLEAGWAERRVHVLGSNG